MTFTEDWFPPESCDVLAQLARHTNSLQGDVVEVGCWEGRSTIALAAAVAPTTVHAVDTWLGSQGEISAELAAERDVFATFQANTAGLNIVSHRQSWMDYFAEHDGPIRFLHIDGEHSFRAVFDNIAVALPRMVSGGIICGDDAHHDPVIRAVSRFFPEPKLNATLWWTQT